jgi:hypothetical protein
VRLRPRPLVLPPPSRARCPCRTLIGWPIARDVIAMGLALAESFSASGGIQERDAHAEKEYEGSLPIVGALRTPSASPFFLCTVACLPVSELQGASPAHWPAAHVCGACSEDAAVCMWVSLHVVLLPGVGRAVSMRLRGTVVCCVAPLPQDGPSRARDGTHRVGAGYQASCLGPCSISAAQAGRGPWSPLLHAAL